MPARLLAALLLVLGSATAEEPLLFVSRVEHVEALSDPESGKAYALLGRVTIESGRLFSVRADRAVVWLDPDTDATVFKLIRELRREGGGIPLWAVRGVYAEGARTPVVFQTAGQIFRCSALYYDFRAHRGIFLDADLRLRRGERREDTPDLVLRAKELRLLGPGNLVARDALLFPSNYEDHEVAVTVREVRIEDPALRDFVVRLQRISARDYREGRGPTAAEVDALAREIEGTGADLASKLFTLRDLTVRALDVPIFRWGDAEMEGSDVMPLRLEADFGSQGGFGSGGRLAAGLGLQPVGFLVGGGYIDDHGPFADLSLDVFAFGGRVTGVTEAAYLNDHGVEDGVAPETENRFWTQNFYRWRVSPVWRIDAEYADISDPAFLLDWNEKVVKEGLDQETLLYLRGRTETAYVTLLAQWRTIGFQDEVERLPSLGGFLPSLTLLRLGEDSRGEPITLQVSLPASVGNLRHRQGEGFPLPDFRSYRATVDPTFFVSFALGPFRVVPFATAGVTAYENDLAGDSAARTTVSGGVRIDTQLARWFGRVRHVVNLSLSYEDLAHVSVPASELFPFDAVDQVTPWEGLSLRWRNRLLRAAPDGLVEILSFEISGSWFPEGEQPLGRRGDWYLDWEAWWQATRTLLVISRGDLPEGTLETASVEAWWSARSDLGFGVSMRHLEGDSDILTLGAEVEVGTRWSLVGFSQYDAHGGEASDQGLLVRRLGKTGVIGVRVTYDPGDDGFGVSVNFDFLERFREKQRRRDTLRSLVGWQ
jgi:hypothetical protein